MGFINIAVQNRPDKTPLSAETAEFKKSQTHTVMEL
jgi:hypothetical protein